MSTAAPAHGADAGRQPPGEGRARSPVARRDIGAIPPISRRQQVADMLHEAIVSGELAAGEQLKQDQLSQELGVSPGPLREAMRQLESEGLVTLRPNQGVFVSEVSAEELFGVLLPVRLVIERYTAPRAAARFTKADYAEFERLVQVMEEGAQQDNYGMVNEADLRFHELTVTAAGAAHATQLWNSVLPRIRMHVYQSAPRHRTLAEIPAEHRDLLNALRTRDASVIGAALEQHIIGAARKVLGATERDG
jgi:DNA-binding GntR family transcriptional regulator